MSHTRKGFGIFRHTRDINHPGNIRSAPANKDPYSRFLTINILFTRIFFFTYQSAASFGDSLGSPKSRTAGHHHRLRNIHRCIKSTTNIDTGARSLVWLKLIGFTEAELVSFNFQGLCQFLCTVRRLQSNRQYHHIKFFSSFALSILIHVFQQQAAILQFSNHRTGHGLNVFHPEFLLGGNIISFKTFAESPNIHVKNGWLDTLIMLSGYDRLFGSVHATYR